ncbi:MAG: ABC transporter ATP-binding protein [Saprospiraceae bacterium]|nr:ABC transporter ATP-binding protein [Saprospiraceae bacterium]
MNIRVENLGKRYRFDWIFKGMSYQFEAGKRYAILGANGSGKSTLMKILSGHLSPSKGKLVYELSGKTINPDDIYRQVAYAAPYIDLIEELTLEEAIRFHAGIKPLLPTISEKQIIELLALPKARNKEIRHFSSGMKQRLKLMLAMASDTPILLLDEPSTNLDLQGIAWYKNLIQEFASTRLVIIASNDPHDLEICEAQISIMDYKK